MAFNIKGWKRGPARGSVGVDAAATRAQRYQHYYDHDVDDHSALVAANYLNSLASFINKGDRLSATMSIATVPVGKEYVFTSARGVTPVTIALIATV